MAFDPDIQRDQTPVQQVYANGQYYGAPQTTPMAAYPGQQTGKAGVSSVVMAVFTVLNLFFLIVAASYSLGIFETSEATTDGASFLVVAIMTLLSGGLGLLTSYIGLRMSRLAGSPLFVLVHKVLFVAVIVSAVLVFIGPVFR